VIAYIARQMLLGHFIKLKKYQLSSDVNKAISIKAKAKA